MSSQMQTYTEATASAVARPAVDAAYWIVAKTHSAPVPSFLSNTTGGVCTHVRSANRFGGGAALFGAEGNFWAPIQDTTTKHRSQRRKRT